MTYPPAIKNITAGKLVRALKRDGFFLARRAGARFIFLHPDGRMVPVHYHRSSQTFPPGTLRAMLTQARWSTADLIRLRLIPKHIFHTR
jgi:predicted RNA binding protein YcfA (HicA-like mRNA interferase family)